MNPRLPCFYNDYSTLEPELRALDLHARDATIRQTLTVLRERLKQATHSIITPQMVLQDILKLVQASERPPADKRDRQRLASSMLQRYSLYRKFQFNGVPCVDVGVEIAQRTVHAYLKIDEKALLADLQALAGELDSREPETSPESLAADIATHEAGLAGIWPETVADFFRTGYPPQSWRGSRLGKNCTAIELLQRMAAALADDWKRHAAKFKDLITPLGIIVSTLPSSEQTIWRERAAALGVLAGTNGRYDGKRFQEPTTERQRGEQLPDHVPAAFAEQETP